MSTEEYNEISRVYQALTRRFDTFNNFSFDGFYIAFDPQFYAVRDENLEVLKKFEKLTLRDIFTNDYINSKPFGDKYLDSKLVVIEQNRILVSTELGWILFYVLIQKLHTGFEEFKKIIPLLVKKYSGFVFYDSEKDVYSMSIETFNNILPKFESNEKLKFVVHLFSKTNSGQIIPNWINEIEIKMSRIKEIDKTLALLNVQILNI